MPHFFMYLTASKRNGTLYTGQTSNLAGRIKSHREHYVKGFTDDYDVVRLVHFEVFETREQALTREKQVKEWKRAWKIELIEKNNPEWKDLYDTLVEDGED